MMMIEMLEHVVEVNNNKLTMVPISVTKQAAWTNQSSKVDKFRQISMANVICHANQPNNLSKAMTYKHNYFISLQYNYYLMVKKSTVAFQPSLNTVAKLYTINKFVDMTCIDLHFTINNNANLIKIRCFFVSHNMFNIYIIIIINVHNQSTFMCSIG
jgi:hypothetical protein